MVVGLVVVEGFEVKNIVVDIDIEDFGVKDFHLKE
jgi:hypothetical protein